MKAPSLVGLLVSHWQPAWALNVAGALWACAYLWAAQHKPGWPVSRSLSFLAGIGVVLVALESGISSYDDRVLSVHMVQHMLLLLAAPLLLLAGQPLAVAMRGLPGQGRRAVARALRRTRPFTGPLQCLAVFTAVVLITHVPAFYDATLRHAALHDAEHIAYLAAGLLVWWPLLDTEPSAAYRLSGLGKLIYMLAMMPSMALVGAYLNRHTSLVYPAYGPPGHTLGISAVVDQQQAGAIMWVAGSMIVVVAGLWIVVAAMISEERRQQAREAREQLLRLDGGQT